MDKEYLKKHPELDELSKRVCLDDSRAFRRKNLLKNEIVAELAKFYDFEEEDLKAILATLLDLKKKNRGKASSSVKEAPVDLPSSPSTKPREVG